MILLLVLKGVLVPIAIKLAGWLPLFWLRALGWFAAGAAFAAVPPRPTTVKQYAIVVGACAISTTVLILATR